MREASRGAVVPLLVGSVCLMPASVRAEAVRVVGVEVPEEEGVRAAGAMVGGCVC